MRILYIFPHPDDESFGPALAISAQRHAGHEVHLLTLTRGGATRQRHRLGLSVEEMGALRFEEMKKVAQVLDLNGMEVLDYPDGKLKEINPRDLELVIKGHAGTVRPEIVVTYPVHGISGFHDHLVTHAVVKSSFCELRESQNWLRRLAFFTLAPSPVPDPLFQLQTSSEEEIDCAVEVDDTDVDTAAKALACYETYQETIEQADPLGRTGKTIFFEIFGERHDPPLSDLSAGLG